MRTDHSIGRRCLLKVFALSMVTGNLIACTHKKFFNPDEDILLSGGSFGEGDSKQNALILINLLQKEKRLIETPFLPHHVSIDPNNKYRLLCFEKNGINACEIDLQAQRLSRSFQAGGNRLFSGHAVFSADGSRIMSIESDNNSLQGSISIRDSNTFDIMRTLPTLGLLPHDCQLTADNVLLVSNSGQSESGLHQPSLVAIDMNREKLIRRLKLDDETLNCGHFKLSEDNRLVVASAPADRQQPMLPGGVSIETADAGTTDAVISTMKEPEMIIRRMTGEALGIEINQQQQVVAVTHPDASLLTFWSLQENSLARAYAIENPRGICQTLDRKHFILSYGLNPALARVSTSDLMPLADSIVTATLSSGEHLINWSLELRKIMPQRVYD